MGTLYIIGTPIGNLGDITDRAIQVLKSADFIFAEDTRVTKKLCARFEIHKPLVRCDMYSRDRSAKTIGNHLKNDKTVALVTDAGTPGIADPGAFIVSYVRENIAEAAIVPIPGPSAITTALSISGFSADKFTFLGYPPHKKKRSSFFSECAQNSNRPIVLFESPHRIERTIKDLSGVLTKGANIVIGRELTKKHEEIFSGTIEKALLWIKGKKILGEFVIILS